MKDTTINIDLHRENSKFSFEKSVGGVHMRKTRVKSNSSSPDSIVPYHYRDDLTGQVTFKLTLDSTASWKNESSSEQVSLKFVIPTKFTVNITNDHDREWWENIVPNYVLNSIDGTLPGMGDITVNVPELHLDFGAIDYFLETNLLFPGKHVFKSGKIPDDFYFPHGIFIGGSLIKT